MRSRQKRESMAKTIEEQLSDASKIVMVTSNTLGNLLSVFKESISQLNSDQRYWIEKLELHNSIGEALLEHLAELTDSLTEANKEKYNDRCKESWRRTLKQLQCDLTTLTETTESFRNTTSKMLKRLD